MSVSWSDDSTWGPVSMIGGPDEPEGGSDMGGSVWVRNAVLSAGRRTLRTKHKRGALLCLLHSRVSPTLGFGV